MKGNGTKVKLKNTMTKGKIIIISILSILLIATIAIVMSLVIAHNQQITISILGDNPLNIEYGMLSEYVDEGASATCSDMFASTPQSIEVISEGTPDLNTLGTYIITYTASKYKTSVSATRKINVIDTTPPEIKLITSPDNFTQIGEEYMEEGFSAFDLHDGDVTDKVTSKCENDKIIYSVTDSSGNTASATRLINYKDFIAPEIELFGEDTITLNVGTDFSDPGYKATDNIDGDITGKVKITGEINKYLAGTYQITYSVEDSYGNTDTKTRSIIIKPILNPSPANIKPGSKTIYLTFDDGPGPNTQRLLDILDKYNVKATFFVVNGSYNNMIKEEYSRGHSVGIHSATHDYKKIYASQDAFFNDLNTMADIIYNQTGTRTNITRFPGGSSNTVSKFNPGIMTSLVNAVHDNGYEYFDWNVSSGDAGSTTSSDVVYSNVINGISGKNYAVVLQHDSKSYSVDAVERIITWGLSNGYVFAPLTASSPSCHHGVNN